MCAHTPGLVGTANVFHLNSWLTFSHLVFLHSISHAMFCIGLGRVWNTANYFYLFADFLLTKLPFEALNARNRYDYEVFQ